MYIPSSLSTNTNNCLFHSGRVAHISQLLAWHPSFLEKFSLTSDHIMFNGPLSVQFTHYLSIMAVAQYECEYLLGLQENSFKSRRGEPRWLLGLNYAPEKLQALAHINGILAHQPWRLRKNHLVDVLRTEDSTTQWTNAELVHAIVILVHFHSCTLFCLCCSLLPCTSVSVSLPFFLLLSLSHHSHSIFSYLHPLLQYVASFLVWE